MNSKTIILAALVASSSIPAYAADNADDFIYLTKKGLEKRLKDPDSAEYRNVRYNGGQPHSAVCGEVNSKNSYGGYTGFVPFFGVGDAVFMPSDGKGEFVETYNLLCR
ncbi:MAG: hypothetical protein CMM93_02310 [Rickettsiales bacterium]|nr:hypothetical protein [Rickettsiales bacterium]|tara:strand:+ start:854 stop:1177 length:324 start_codon:yes stop_codon:yes gene_type:complete